MRGPQVKGPGEAEVTQSTLETEMRALVDAVRCGELTPEQSDRLGQLLQHNEQAARLYIDWMHQHAAIRLMVGPALIDTNEWSDAVGTPDEQRVELPEPAEAKERKARGGAFRAWRLAATVVACGVALGLLGALLNRNSAPIEQPRDLAITVAELRADYDCVWSGMKQKIPTGTKLFSGQKLDLEKGTAKLAFKSGATVVVEGPASFDLLTGNSIRFDRGTIAVRADGPTKDFAVNCRDASIVDLGTSFGIHCEDNQSTNLEVFEGAVKVVPGRASSESRVLGLGSSAQLTCNGESVSLDTFESETDQFANLLEKMWLDKQAVDVTSDTVTGDGDYVSAEFSEAPLPEAVDSFYGAAPGRVGEHLG